MNDSTIKPRSDEIERLRAAGDALHAWITINATSTQQEHRDYDQVLDAWEEARRGRPTDPFIPHQG